MSRYHFLPDHIPLSQLTAAVSDVVDSAFGEKSFWVVADVTDHKYYPEKGHHYFSLVEKDPRTNALIAKVAAVCWRTGTGRLRDFEKATGQPFTNGINVLVNVTVDFHPVFGLKLTLQDINPAFTIGKLEQQRRETLELLLKRHPETVQFKDGQFVTFNQGVAMKPVIQRIAVITSLNSAGFEDFRHTLETNPFGYDFRLETFYAAVQGIENAPDLVQRFEEVAASKRPFDAVVLIRGGGSQTDFLVFDTFLLGETVAGFPIPVITGIGHQVNETIVDLIAHTPLKTPTKAAEFIIARNRVFEESLLQYQHMLAIRTQQLLAGQLQELNTLHNGLIHTVRELITGRKEELAGLREVTLERCRELLSEHSRRLLSLSHRIITRPGMVLENRQLALRHAIEQVSRSSRKFFISKRGYLNHFQSVVRLMSPENILKKGFSIILHNGKIAASTGGIEPGDAITVVSSDRELSATVTKKTQRHGEKYDL